MTQKPGVHNEIARWNSFINTTLFESNQVRSVELPSAVKYSLCFIALQRDRLPGYTLYYSLLYSILVVPIFHNQPYQSLPATYWSVLYITTERRGYFPSLISGTTGPILKAETAFDMPVKFVEGKKSLLTSPSLSTSQVRSKIKRFTIYGS